MRARDLMIAATALSATCLAFAAANAADEPESLCSTTVVSAWFADRAQVDAFAEHAEPWEVHHDKGWMVVGVDADELQLLLDLGFETEIDQARTAEICSPRKRLIDQTEVIPGYPCYRTVEETMQTAQDLVVAYPNLASLVDVGDSWEKTTPGGVPGYDMMVLELTNSAVAGTPPSGTDGKPRLFVTSSIHAREYTPAELMTRFAEYLLTNFGIDADATWLLDEHEIHLMLHANPDGRKHAEAGLSWHKNTNENYCGATSTSRGADLNRNFEFLWGCCGGSSGSECDNTYRGPASASEPETQAIQNYARSIFPDQRDADLGAAAPDHATGLYIDVHSYSELVLWPWGFTNTATGNGSQLQTLGRKLAFFNGYEPEQAIDRYPADGTTVDFAYGDLGVPAYVIELGSQFFESCSDFENTILPTNLESMLYAAKIVRTPYLTPAGPDMTDATASATVVAPGEDVTIQATADDTRFSAANGAESTQPIAAAEFYLDAPPWQAGATAVAMTPVDGVFDTQTEAVEALIDTTGLANDRHTLFLRAQDTDGSWGAVSAVFVWVLDAMTAAHIAGTVTSANDGSPLTATVTSGIFSTPTNPGDGAFDLMLPEGVYDVTATADGHGRQVATAVVASAGVVTALDFVLTPFETVIEDDVETGNAGWSAEGQWAITDEASVSPTHSWTDSPGGEYGNSWNFSLISPTLDLLDVADVVLEFSHVFDLESGYDYGYAEYSTDGGGTWTTAASYSGTHISSWKQDVIELPALDHVSNARIRFRINTDVNVTEDGWHIDDIVIRGFEELPPGLLFRDSFESGDLSAWSSTMP